MPRPVWKGQLSFGLVNIPVVLYTAEQPNEMHFNLIDQRNNARVRYQRVNEVTGEEVPWNEIVKGYEYSDGQYVLLSDEDFKQAAIEATQTVEVEDFVDASALDWVYMDKPYYLAPGKKGEKGYVLFREALRKSGRVAIAKVVIRARQHLAAVKPHGEGLVMMLLRFPEELRGIDDLDLPKADAKASQVSPKELEMAEQLVNSMSGDWQPEKYRDDYRDALMSWIEQKAKTGGTKPLESADEPEPAPDVVNIMELLKKSLAERERSGPAARKAAAAGTRPRRARSAEAEDNGEAEAESVASGKPVKAGRSRRRTA